MSTDLMNKVWFNFPGGGSELAILMAIAEACNLAGNCGLPLSKLAGSARLSPSTAFVAVKALRRERWIVASRINGQGGILVLQINIPKLERTLRPDRDPDPPESDAVSAARKVKQRRESSKPDSTRGANVSSDPGC